MGNSCNKVAPDVLCSARMTCTVPLWCVPAQADPKVHPAVVEPKRKEDLQQTTQPTVQETPATPNSPPAPLPVPPPTTAPPATPNGTAKPAPILDPVEPFQPGELVSSLVITSVIEAEPANVQCDYVATLSAAAAAPNTTREQEPTEVTNVEPDEVEDFTHVATEEPVDVAPPAGLADVKDAEAENTPVDVSNEEDTNEPVQDEAEENPEKETDSETDNDERSSVSASSNRSTASGDLSGDEDEGSELQGEEDENEDADASSEGASEELEPFTFDAAALVALERFKLRDKAETLVELLPGQAAVEALQSICVFATDAGAATQNCQLLITQVRIIVHVLVHAYKDGARKAVKSLLEQLHPILVSVQAVVSTWRQKGTMEKFMSGRAADDEFLELHLLLKEFAQSASFAQLFAQLPPEESAELVDLQATQQLSGYCSVEASRVAFERLLLLFILRYKPTKTRTQKQRLLDLLAAYNRPPSLSNGIDGDDGAKKADDGFGCETVEEQIEHLAKTRLGRAATHAVPLMVVMMTNMWGASMEDMPKTKTGKWRMAVRLALEPLRAATGMIQLPQVPEDDVCPWVEDAA
ncbi:hypothetical protein Vretimale_19747 [Volvox reticuliferus]|uniref:Uncharacterized protein n=1 Tax=Volvox reticuliferus TaxID=1737510 RepID=A0A8J4M0W4_9CHLO|nr:hypothetical protein Vretifemale_20741 [Volvox reticuliferus]GIM17246.1 hypothetical protein Vretimale_19747 [Volvox reticuliferus]